MQEFMVGLIVAAAAGYAAWYWMPQRWRRALAARLSGRAPRLAETLAQTPGCGACESCDSCGTSAGAPGALPRRQPGEHSVPLAEVKRSAQDPAPR